ncbi:YcgN family cysteine cluster protein [Desulfonema magnum]|uniref:FAD-binding domain-containing protein n=1 Tax=Desulfonema magnum TaxID=45655 RepID=A0A975BI74_9BACT|nr:YcgN family cysteine cluster protein [Desulfonema magnum]QTA85921.1 FAD-binding domain-containing protein [Desulfonema magnum]
MSEFQEPFWKTKSLSQMTHEEWESLCDGCGLCCLRKLEDMDTGEVFYTDVACFLLDIKKCRCKSYQNRTLLVPTCMILEPAKVKEIRWLPKTCAYRLLAEGKELPWWHPLRSGSDQTVHEAGISIRDKVISEKYVHPEQLTDHIVEWEI